MGEFFIKISDEVELCNNIFKEGYMSNNRFSPEKFHDFSIVDQDNKVVGHVRIKPSGLHWAPSNAKIWYGVSLDKFAKFMEEYGVKKKK